MDWSCHGLYRWRAWLPALGVAGLGLATYPATAVAEELEPEPEAAAIDAEDDAEDAAEDAVEDAAEDAAAPESRDEDMGEAPANTSDVPSPEGPAMPDDQGEESAEDGTAPGDEDAEETPGLHHHKTVGISIAPGFGYAMTIAGDKFCGEFSDAADDSDGRRSVCAALNPAYLDITLSYGVSRQIDIVFGGRVNLQQRDFDASSCDDAEPYCSDGEGLFVNKIAGGIFPGVRIWGKGSEKLVKFGAGIDFMLMFENFDGYRDRPRSPREEPAGTEDYDVSTTNEDAVGDVSIGLRAGPLLAIDPHHNVGLYIFPAVYPSFRPSKSRDADGGWLEIGVDFSAGIQARFP